MILTNEQVKQFEEAAKPLIKFLCDTFSDPHMTVIVTPSDAEILSSSAVIHVTEFVRD